MQTLYYTCKRCSSGRKALDIVGLSVLYEDAAVLGDIYRYVPFDSKVKRASYGNTVFHVFLNHVPAVILPHSLASTTLTP